MVALPPFPFLRALAVFFIWRSQFNISDFLRIRLAVVLLVVDGLFERPWRFTEYDFSTRTDAGGIHIPRKRIMDLLHEREIADSIAT